jgi:hypothetical protein
MTADRLRYVLRADGYAVWLSIVGLASAARIVLFFAFRRIDRAVTLPEVPR